MGIVFKRHEAQALLDFFGDGPDDDETEIAVSWGRGHSGTGLYAHYLDYPDEGSQFLGREDDDPPPEIRT